MLIKVKGYVRDMQGRVVRSKPKMTSVTMKLEISGVGEEVAEALAESASDDRCIDVFIDVDVPTFESDWKKRAIAAEKELAGIKQNLSKLVAVQ